MLDPKVFADRREDNSFFEWIRTEYLTLKLTSAVKVMWEYLLPRLTRLCCSGFRSHHPIFIKSGLKNCWSSFIVYMQIDKKSLIMWTLGHGSCDDVINHDVIDHCVDVIEMFDDVIEMCDDVIKTCVCCLSHVTKLLNYMWTVKSIACF